MKRKMIIPSTLIFIVLMSVICVGVWAIAPISNTLTGIITIVPPAPAVEDESAYPTLTFEITDSTNNYVSVLDNGASGEVVIPSKVLIDEVEYTVTSLGTKMDKFEGLVSAFYSNNFITSITIPGTIKTIDSYAFDSCSSLTHVVLLSGVEYIDDYAFYGCSSLVSIELPNTLFGWGLGVFFECNKLECFRIPKSVQSVGIINDGFCSFTTVNYEGTSSDFYLIPDYLNITVYYNVYCEEDGVTIPKFNV